MLPFSRLYALRLDDLRLMARDFVVWGILATLTGIGVGCAGAFFLVLLAAATDQFSTTPALIFGLPLVGMVIVWAYHHYGGSTSKGTALVVEALHTPSVVVPLVMTPFVLLGTVFTHLFGGSAGREGTGVQMGGSLAATLGDLLRLPVAYRAGLLSAGTAAGFSAVFGTPVAGIVFALEVARVGQLRTRHLLPALIGAFTADLTVRALGVGHIAPPQLPILALDLFLLGKVALAGIAFGLASLVFVLLLETLRGLHLRYLPYPPVRPFFGGLAVVGLTLLVGNTDYNGLSLPLLMRSVEGQEVAAMAFAFKLVLTVVTVGSGFVGGEVTPLFVIGATLGATLAGVLDVEQGFLASIGFVAVFGSAANVPMAGVVMGIELFGGGALPYLMVGCGVAWLVSGKQSIYPTQQSGSKVSVGEQDTT